MGMTARRAAAAPLLLIAHVVGMAAAFARGGSSAIGTARTPSARLLPVALAGNVLRTRAAGAARSAPRLADAPRAHVAVAGGGVGGLCTALCLLKKGIDVTVYERTDAFRRFGGPIQFASNALSTLHAVDPALLDKVMEKFTFTGTRACGIKDGLRASGFSMAGDSLNYLWDPSAPADWYVRFPLRACAKLWGLPYTGVIDRPDLQELLLEACTALKPDFIRNGVEVLGYEQPAPGEPGAGVRVRLSSGELADHDALVGADGIWSGVRAQMYGEELKKPVDGGRTRQGCTYSGYTVYAGEAIMRLPDYYECGYKVYIGPKRYFVTSDVGGGRVQWYAFFATPPGMKRARSGWGAESELMEGRPAESLIDYLKGLHEGWSDEIHHVLSLTPEDAVEQRDLYDRPPELFRSWTDGRVTLLGDAIHPMMPNLGQGGCQAVEDAYVLADELAARLCAEEGGERDERVRAALDEYYRKRIGRTAAVQLLSRLASDLIINLFDTPWSPHDERGTDWKSYLTFFWKPVLQYLVFPVQFAYLYSFRPSGPLGELPDRLDDAWRTRHRDEAERAFANAEAGNVAAAPRASSFVSSNESS